MRPLGDSVSAWNRSDILCTANDLILSEKPHLHDNDAISIKGRFQLVAQFIKNCNNIGLISESVLLVLFKDVHRRQKLTTDFFQSF